MLALNSENRFFFYSHKTLIVLPILLLLHVPVSVVVHLLSVLFVHYSQKNLAAVLEKEERVGMVNGREETVTLPTISAVVSSVLKSLFMVLDYLFREHSRSA